MIKANIEHMFDKLACLASLKNLGIFKPSDYKIPSL